MGVEDWLSTMIMVKIYNMCMYITRVVYMKCIMNVDKYINSIYCIFWLQYACLLILCGYLIVNILSDYLYSYPINCLLVLLAASFVSSLIILVSKSLNKRWKFIFLRGMSNKKGSYKKKWRESFTSFLIVWLVWLTR